MMKKLSLLILSFVLSFSLVGCQPAGNSGTSGKGSYPMTITDQVGREVTIEKEPERIISGYYISTSLLIALGEDENLVGVENKAKDRNIYNLRAKHIVDLPNVGTAKQFDLEKSATLNPDLLILPYKLKDKAEAIEQLGIPVIFVKPETQESLEEMVTLIGKVTNTEAKAKELLTFTSTQMSAMKDKIKNEAKPTVYMAGNSSFLSTAGKEMYQHTLIENAGGKNVAEGLTDTYWCEVSYEDVLTYNPEYIILAADANYSVEDVLNDKQLKTVEAVKNGNVYKFPSDIESWDSPVPASVLGNLWLASVLHKDAYTTADYEKALKDFYETFYGFVK